MPSEEVVVISETDSSSSSSENNVKVNDELPEQSRVSPTDAEKSAHEVVDLEDEDESEMNYIRIRSQDDGIFEQEDDDDDEYDEIYHTQVALQPNFPPARKRKQHFDNRYSDIIEVHEEEEEEAAESFNDSVYAMDPMLYKSRKRDRVPLYLLNPQDYSHDPTKQRQIRRAIITYRHHQDKKEQIIKLTDENKKLRAHNDALKAKVLELKGCGCEKNRNANVDELKVVIPVVPPRQFLRGSKPVLAVPYNRCAMSPTSFLKTSTEDVKHIMETENDGVAAPYSEKTHDVKPVIDFSSPQANSKPISSGTTVVSSDGRPLVNSGSTPRFSNRFLNLGSNGSAFAGQDRRVVAVPIIKSEPVTVSNIENPFMKTSVPPNLTAATATTASRIVFARKPNPIRVITVPGSSKPKTASQLLFGSKAPTNPISCMGGPVTITAPTKIAIRTTAVTSSVSTFLPIQSTPQTAQAGQVFQAASGQMLMVVASSNGPSHCTRIMSRTPQPILPKRSRDAVLSAEEEKRKADEIWKKFNEQHDGDDDELAIIAAINGASPPPARSSRKQIISKDNSFEEEELDFNKYQDIVFEEAETD